jgi:hypothetical protein
MGSPLTLVIKILPPRAQGQRNRDELVKIKCSKSHPAMHLKKMSPRRNIGDPTKHDKEWEAERWCLMVFERQKKKRKERRK